VTTRFGEIIKTDWTLK